MQYARLRFYSIPSSSQGYRTDDEVWVVLWQYSTSICLGALPSLFNRTAAKHMHSEDKSRVVKACGGRLSCCPERSICKHVGTHDYVQLMTGPKSPPIAWVTGWVCKNPVTRRSHKWRPKAGRNLVVDRSDSLEGDPQELSLRDTLLALEFSTSNCICSVCDAAHVFYERTIPLTFSPDRPTHGLDDLLHC
jgi:hypothetical protein